MTFFRPAARVGLILFALVLVPLAAGEPSAFAQPADEAAPPDPAAAPPTPARLPLAAPAAQPLTSPLASPPGMEPLPEGRWRVRFTNDTATLTTPTAAALTTLGQRLAVLPEGRITVEAQASGPAADVSVARRLSLARGLAVKQALADGGLPPTRIDIRALGRTDEAVDAADVLPPNARRADAPSAVTR